MHLMVDDFVAGLDMLVEPDAVASRFASAIEAFGFRHYSFVARGRSSETTRYQYVSTNYPECWNRHFVESEYFEIDPTLQRARSAALPFAWSDLTDSEELQPEQRRLFDEAAAVGLRHGFAVPIHAPGGGDGLVAIANDESPAEFSATMRHHRNVLHLLSLHFHAASTAAWRRLDKAEPERAPAQTIVTAREADCLLWTARGKSAWEVAAILGISERTVNFHLENTRRKLNAQTKTQAVVQAIVLKLINP